MQEVKPQTLSHKPLPKYTSGREAVVVLEDTHCNHDSYTNWEEEIQIIISSCTQFTPNIIHSLYTEHPLFTNTTQHNTTTVIIIKAYCWYVDTYLQELPLYLVELGHFPLDSILS